MKVWPLTQVLGSPMLDRAYAYELAAVYKTRQMSKRTFEMCRIVTRDLVPMETPLVLIESEDATMAYSYIERPKPEDFARLERALFVKTDTSFVGFLIDRLH